MSPEGSANIARFLALRSVAQGADCALMVPVGTEKNGDIAYQNLTFAELSQRTAQVARGFEASGMQRGQRILLMVRPGVELILCSFALFRMGAVPVVIDPGMGLRSFLNCVRQTRPDGIVAIRAGLLLSRVFRQAFAGVSMRVAVNKGFAVWMNRFSGDPYTDFAPGPNDLAAILFTSGSTGPPKGVCYGHGQFDAQVRLVRETFNIEPGEIDFPMLPIFALFNPALGMTTVVPEINPSRPATFDPQRNLRAIQQTGVTNSFASPVLWDKLVRYASRNSRKLLNVRRILSAGAAVPPDLVQRMRSVFPKAKIWSPYGATECLPVTAVEGDYILSATAQRTREGAGICVGEPVAGVEVRIIQIAEGPIASFVEANPLEQGEIGEIIATGPSVTQAYDRLPKATQYAKIVDEKGRIWHRMGDAGYLDEVGRLWFCGRLSERVQTAQGVLYTECCEGIFHGLPGVRRVALIGIGDGPSKEPALVVEPIAGERFSSDIMLQRASEHPLTSCIRQVFRCKRFPVDVRHNAKINRLELSRRYSG